MRRTLPAAAVAAVLGLAGCSSSASKPAAAPTSQAPAVSITSQPPATCSLKPQGDIIERIVVPGQPATAQQLGGVDLRNCTLTFSDLADETSKDPGYCTQAAWLSDNPNYDVNAVPAPPLKKIQAQAGQACG
jgi:hypothetical protein